MPKIIHRRLQKNNQILWRFKNIIQNFLYRIKKNVNVKERKVLFSNVEDELNCVSRILDKV